MFVHWFFRTQQRLRRLQARSLKAKLQPLLLLQLRTMSSQLLFNFPFIFFSFSFRFLFIFFSFSFHFPGIFLSFSFHFPFLQDPLDEVILQDLLEADEEVAPIPVPPAPQTIDLEEFRNTDVDVDRQRR